MIWFIRPTSKALFSNTTSKFQKFNNSKYILDLIFKNPRPFQSRSYSRLETIDLTNIELDNHGAFSHGEKINRLQAPTKIVQSNVSRLPLYGNSQLTSTTGYILRPAKLYPMPALMDAVALSIRKVVENTAAVFTSQLTQLTYALM